ncbi:transglycosylase SLT domain-containing protein [Arcobacter roscoffensis]|uniref:Transglycosylase SLT domain-containing protein n=1 Tax=Arcobacter roscoffensis TaxID=2961520 RepID=A0ABY5E5E7_9BACT|nr:transglycosylase SLT domain-containing protein [Arcobacter roscoffensis]UTJ06400.1 transglycosylase SLT domain-containing protein [Arcobacter roscoffensis]
MKAFFYLLLFSTFLFSNSLNLNKKDLVILKKIKSLSDDEMLSYSLMAIAIKESKLGKYVVNHKTKDYGLFQANIKTVISRQKVKDTKENREFFANKLINDVSFSTANAIIELEYWRKVHKDNWAKTWASYNTGWRYDGKTGFKYANSIFEIIKKLKLEYRL